MLLRRRIGPCRMCGHPISNFSKACPNCGDQTSYGLGYDLIWLLILIAAVWWVHSALTGWPEWLLRIERGWLLEREK